MKPTCEQRLPRNKVCGKPAVAIMRWPNKFEDRYVCETHKNKGEDSARALGVPVRFVPIPDK